MNGGDGRREDDGDRTVSAGPDDVSLDAVFDVLGNARRRHVLYALADAEAPVGVADVVDRLCEFEGTETDDQRGRVAMSLYHVHLPKLAAADLVDFDPDRETVEPTAWPDALTAFLGLATRYESAGPATGESP